MFLGLIASSRKLFRENQWQCTKSTEAGWNITWKQWLLFLKKKHKDIVKLNFLQCLDLIAMKILSPKIWINEI